MSSCDDTLTNIFDQVIEGWDIPKPTSLNLLKASNAATKLDGAPYSALTNLAHAVLWQDAWLARLRGEQVKQQELWENDFRVPDVEEYPTLRRRFVEGLSEARRYAKGELKHGRESDAKARDILVGIAVHASYHMGQVSLLSRMAKAGRPGS